MSWKHLLLRTHHLFTTPFTKNTSGRLLLASGERQSFNFSSNDSSCANSNILKYVKFRGLSKRSNVFTKISFNNFWAVLSEPETFTLSWLYIRMSRFSFKSTDWFLYDRDLLQLDLNENPTLVWMFQVFLKSTFFIKQLFYWSPELVQI